MSKPRCFSINSNTKFGIILCSVVLLLAGCGGGNEPQGDLQPTDQLGVVRARLVVDNQLLTALGDGLSAVRIDVLKNTTLVDSKIISLDLSDTGADVEGDAFFALNPGDYSVLVTPLSSSGGPSRICASATSTASVVATQTTEIRLIIVCSGDATGGLDVIIDVTHPPVIDDLVFMPSKFGSTCRRIGMQVFASGENLVYDWSVTNSDTNFSMNGFGAIAYFAAETAESYQATVKVSNVAGSVASLSFPMHISTGDIQQCLNDDRDGDSWPNVVDNCPSVHNPGQEDSNNDGIGDACSNAADLVITRLGVTPQPGVAGESMSVHVVVANRGGAPAAASQLVACSRSDPDFCTFPAKVPALAVGELATVVAILPGDRTLTREGTTPLEFIAHADSGKIIPESIEDNNQATTRPFFIVVPFIPNSVVEQDHDDIFTFENGKIISTERVSYPGGAPSDNIKPSEQEKEGVVEDPPVFNPAPKIDPLLKEEIAGLSPEDRIQVVLLLKSSFPMRRLPELVPGENRFSKRNAPLLAKRQAAFEGLKRARLGDAVDKLQKIVGPMYDRVRVMEFLTLSGALVVEIPVLDVELLADHADVLHLDSVNLSGEYLDDGITTNDIIDARQQLNTDPYFNAGAEGGGFYFGVIDSGVRITHTNFNGPDQIDYWRDCFHTTSVTCIDTGDTDWAPGDGVNHGTKVMGIVNANSSLGGAWRGVADTTTDSWDVTNDAGTAPSCLAVERALNAAALVADKVVTASLSCGGDETGTSALAADDAYDAGMLVFFANGNNGPGAGTVSAPASAHKVIGVGAFDITSGNQYNGQSRGPTNDGRIKPDLQAPTSSESTSNASNTAQGTICCTSGATPYASAAGLLLTDWFGSFLTSPGKIYAMMINYGENRYGFIDNTEGVGPFRLGTGGVHVSGSRTLTFTGQNVYVNLNVPPGKEDLRAAIWWPENAGDAHNDIDLRLEHPLGTSVQSSLSINSVFEHVIVSDPASGSWRIRIRAYSLPTGPQTIYYAVRYGP